MEPHSKKTPMASVPLDIFCTTLYNHRIELLGYRSIRKGKHDLGFSDLCSCRAGP